jgi:transcriptional regulator with XRE-family HTH domain
LFDSRCEELGITSEIDKARLGGVDTSTLWRFRRGEMGPRLEVARRFARALAVSTDDLWKDVA